MTWWDSEFYAFIDGSQEFQANSSCLAGIGGCIRDKRNSLLFIFSGPISATSPREAKREAIVHVYKAFSTQRTIQGRLQINTDCISLVEEFQKQSAGLLKLEGSEYWLQMVQNMNIKLKYISREYLLGAHDLAKQGAKRVASLRAWCQILISCNIAFPLFMMAANFCFN